MGKRGKHFERNQAVADAYKSGKSLEQVGNEFGLCVQYVRLLAKQYGVTWRDHRSSELAKQSKIFRIDYKSDRNAAIAERHASGKTLAQVGEEFGITRERVRQVLAKSGIGKMDGGATIRLFKNTHDRLAAHKERHDRMDANCFKKWGMPLSEYKKFVAIHGSSARITSPLHKYITHRSNAMRRGIEWGFTFPEWWEVWRESGKWELRGRGKNYMMGRYGDFGPYCKNNVYICTGVENTSDSYIAKPHSKRQRKSGSLGSGRGYYRNPKLTTAPYVVYIKKTYIGAFKTPDAAHEAYLAAAQNIRSNELEQLTKAAA